MRLRKSLPCFILFIVIAALAFFVLSKERQTLPYETREILRPFFKKLLKESSAGYVIYGNKPVYLGSFCLSEWLLPKTEKHRETVEVTNALRLLESLTKDMQARNFIFVLYRNEFLIINRRAFLKVVKDHLELFRERLGSWVTAETLLERLVGGSHSFSDLFGRHPALQGIVLGYGKENAVTFERVTHFIDKVIADASPKPPMAMGSLPTSEEEMIAFLETTSSERSLWLKIKEETNDFTYYTPRDDRDSLKIPFGFHSNSCQTQDLISDYRTAQIRIDRLLNRENFLKVLLKDLQIWRQALVLKQESLVKSISCFSESLARSIKAAFSEEISPEFIEGIKTAYDTLNIDVTRPYEEINFFDQLREHSLSMPCRRASVKESSNFFKALERDERVKCLVPGRLCYLKLREGNSSSVLKQQHTSILANFLIKDVRGGLILDGCRSGAPQEINIENVIPGLAHGLMGMNKGEIRVIYIHPDFAYGTYSSFGNGMAIQVQIELIDCIQGKKELQLPALRPTDIATFSSSISSCEEFNRLKKAYNFYCGFMIGSHYKKVGHLIDLDVFVRNLEQGDFQPCSIEELQYIAKIDLLAYQSL